MRFKNINELYKINRVKEGKIVINFKDKIKNVYLYKITPVQILNLSLEIQEKILITYKEFLKEINFDFQIVSINKRLDIERYIKEYYKNSLKNSYIYNSYIDALIEEFDNKTVYVNEFYIIVIYNGNIEHVDRIIEKISEVGCNVNRIKDKVELEKILYKSFNKYY